MEFVIKKGVLKRYRGKEQAVTIPDGVTAIGDRAFFGNHSLFSVTLPEGVTAIGPEAFAFCCELSYITLPQSLVHVHETAFLDCHALNVRISRLQPYLQLKLPVLHDLYLDTKPVHRVALTKGVARIVDGAFCNCQSLTEVVLGEGLTEIGESAFSLCGNLTSIILPSTLTRIGASAFKGCDHLAGITIPDSVTEIGAGAFLYCQSMTWVTLPKALKRIADKTFFCCKKLSGIQLPQGLTEIGEAAFQDCLSLTAVTVPQGVTELGGAAFQGCTGLVSLTLPDSITDIGMWAFADTAPKEFDIPPKVWRLLSDAARKAMVSDAVLRAFLSGSAQQNPNMRAAVIAQLNLREIRVPLLEQLSQSGQPAQLTRLLEVLKKAVPLEEIDHFLALCPDSAAETKTVWLEYKAGHYTAEAIAAAEQIAFDKALGLAEYDLADWRKVFRFSFVKGEAVISGYRGSDTVIVIPESISDHRVTWIRDGAFSDRTDLDRVVIPDSVCRIGARAFPDPDEAPVLQAAEGSYAARYAQEHGFSFEAIGSGAE